MEIILGPLTCGIYLYDLKTQRLLIGHVTGLDDKIYSIPKGEPDPIDKDEWTSAVRELREETSIDINTIGIVMKQEYEKIKYPTRERYLKPFLVTFISGQEMPETVCLSYFTKTDGSEHPEIDSFKWVTLEEAENFLPPVQLHYLPQIKAFLNTSYVL